MQNRGAAYGVGMGAGGAEGGWDMERSRGSAAGGALFLTAMGGVSQLLAFFYRAMLSRMVGAQVMGLYQLLMPVYSVLLSLTAVGLTAAVSNLTSRYLALGSARGAARTVTMCRRLFFAALVPVALVVAAGSDAISTAVLGDARTQLGLVMLLPCVALTGVENLHKHWFYGAGRVVPPAVADLAEQAVRTLAVLGLLVVLHPRGEERTVGVIVAGMVVCELCSALTLTALYRWARPAPGPGALPGRRELLSQVGHIALPVALSALLGNLMGAANAVMVPQKLVEAGLTREEAMSAFGVVCGMTLPMLALPTVFLGAVNLVMVPRVARLKALGRRDAVRRGAHRAMTAAAIVLLPSLGMMVVLGPQLGRLVFGRGDAGEHLLPLAVGMALSCGHSLCAAVLNGVGCQGTAAAISLLCGGTQLAVTWWAVPRQGMEGYVAGVVLSSALGLALSALAAWRRAGIGPGLGRALLTPFLAAALTVLDARLLLVWLTAHGAGDLDSALITVIFGGVLYFAALQAQGADLLGLLRPGESTKGRGR